jgi:hypothetical protein
LNYEAAGDAHVWQPTNLAARHKPLISVPSALRSRNSHRAGWLSALPPAGYRDTVFL